MATVGWPAQAMRLIPPCLQRSVVAPVAVRRAVSRRLAMGAYCGAVFQAFGGMDGPHEVLPGELLTILTGSQGVYLGAKIPTRTPEA